MRGQHNHSGRTMERCTRIQVHNALEHKSHRWASACAIIVADAAVCTAATAHVPAACSYLVGATCLNRLCTVCASLMAVLFVVLLVPLVAGCSVAHTPYTVSRVDNGPVVCACRYSRVAFVALDNWKHTQRHVTKATHRYHACNLHSTSSCHSNQQMNTWHVTSHHTTTPHDMT